jgi:hypothetical protein
MTASCRFEGGRQIPIRAIVIFYIGVIAAAAFYRNEIYHWLTKYVLNNNKEEENE